MSDAVRTIQRLVSQGSKALSSGNSENGVYIIADVIISPTVKMLIRRDYTTDMTIKQKIIIITRLKG